MYENIFSKQIRIVEGIHLLYLYFDDEKIKELISKSALIVMGTSVLLSSFRSAGREISSPMKKIKVKPRLWISAFYEDFMRNKQKFLDKVNTIKKERMSVPNSNTEEM